MWEGMDEPLAEGAWPIVSASPLPYYPAQPGAARNDARRHGPRSIADFVAAAQRGERAGFDMIELHAAHGYLLASFISPLTNQRTDEYGGSLENRMRFPLEVFRAMRAAWPDDKPMSVRISATDWIDGGLTGDDAVEVARAFAEAGCDLIDVSTGQTVAGRRAGLRPHVPDAVLRPDPQRGRARHHVRRRHHHRRSGQHHRRRRPRRSGARWRGRIWSIRIFTMRAAAWYGAPGIHCPPQYLAGRDQIFRNSVRDREDLSELKLKAKPKGHRDTWKQAAE